MMDWLTGIFSHVCGQGRCFSVDGAALPLCQRCLGLYAGAAVTFAWVLAAGLWRRGLVCWTVLAANIIVLTAALAGGVHWVDFSPAWRLACGAWTGHVFVLWLTSASYYLWRRRRDPSFNPPWTARDKLHALLMPPALLLAALLFDRLPLGWWAWSLISLAGLLILIACVALSLTLVLTRIFATASRLIHDRRSSSH